MNNRTIEWAPFRVKPGVSETQLLAASTALQEGFLQNQTGFLRRELVRTGDGEYTDIVWWASHAAAEKAMHEVAGSEVCHRYFALMQDADHAEPGQGVSHFTSIAVYQE